MSDFLVILNASISPAERDVVLRAAPPTQAISQRVFLTSATGRRLADLRSMAGIDTVLEGVETIQSLPPLNDAEALFAQAWLSSRSYSKQRPGEGMDWDTPPMLPPDVEP